MRICHLRMYCTSIPTAEDLSLEEREGGASCWEFSLFVLFCIESANLLFIARFNKRYLVYGRL